jgi:hypothetical protein
MKVFPDKGERPYRAQPVIRCSRHPTYTSKYAPKHQKSPEDSVACDCCWDIYELGQLQKFGEVYRRPR